MKARESICRRRQCKKPFNAKRSHGMWTEFCSPECQRAFYARSIHREVAMALRRKALRQEQGERN
jgi:hypothetical protein